MSKIEGIKLNGTVLDIETGSNVDIHIEDDTLVINTDETGNGSSGSSGSNGGLSIAAEIPDGDILNVLQNLCNRLNKSKKYYLDFKFTTELNFGMVYSATTNNGIVIEYITSGNTGWSGNVFLATSSCLVSVPVGVLTPAALVTVNHNLTWINIAGCALGVTIKKLDDTDAGLSSRILRHSVLVTAHELEEVEEA